MRRPKESAEDKRRYELTEKLKGDLYPHERIDFQEFLDSFMDDIVGELVTEFGDKRVYGAKTYDLILAVLRRMIEAWKAGQDRLREEISEL